MATYLVWSGGNNTSGTEAGGWAAAYQKLTSALAVATTAGDVIKVHKTHNEAQTADTTYTIGNNISIICVDKDSSDALAEMGDGGLIGNDTTSYSITVAGSYKVYFYGITFLVSAAGNDPITIGSTDGIDYTLEKCKLVLNAYSASADMLKLGINSSNFNQHIHLKNCTIKYGNANSRTIIQAFTEMDGCVVDSSGTAPSTLCYVVNDSSANRLIANGCDFSHVTGTLIGDCTFGSFSAVFVNCKLGAAVTPLAAQTVANKGSASVWLFNCSSGDNHYDLGHYDAFGNTTISTGIHVADGAEYNETGTKYSWKIVTSGDCSFYTPYISPWIHSHNETLSAITPWLEAMRDNSSGAVFQNDEVWSEFSYQGTSGFPLGVIVNDRMTPLGSAADQTASSKTASDWTGETGTPGFFTIGPASSITPAEIGPLSARVVVGEPSITVYVDPQIRT